jgi:hypothetical protein
LYRWSAKLDNEAVAKRNEKGEKGETGETLEDENPRLRKKPRERGEA